MRHAHRTDAVSIIVIAKAPATGRAKTRLCPPCSPHQAAALAEAALRDTLAAVAATEVDRRVLALDGPAGPWLPPGFEIVPQRGAGLAERIAAAFEDTKGAALLIGMDTPQVDPLLLRCALETLCDRGVGAVLGKAFDGGWWALGLRRPDRRALEGVPMSTPLTGRMQRARLRALGLEVGALPPLRDVDRIEDAEAVAAEAPGSMFAATLSTLGIARRAG